MSRKVFSRTKIRVYYAKASKVNWERTAIALCFSYGSWTAAFAFEEPFRWACAKGDFEKRNIVETHSWKWLLPSARCLHSGAGRFPMTLHNVLRLIKFQMFFARSLPATPSHVSTIAWKMLSFRKGQVLFSCFINIVLGSGFHVTALFPIVI